MTHRMKLQREPFNKVQKGKKIIESRLHDEKRQQVKVGDQIEFVYTDDLSKKVLTKVKALYRYNSFQELFSDFSAESFGGNSKEELLKEIATFYSKEEQENYGVVGIKIELVQ